MTVSPLSSTSYTRLKIVRGLSHAIYGKSHKSPHPDGFGVMGDSPATRLGCLIGGRLGHFLDAAL
jgi:hypothetical protein